MGCVGRFRICQSRPANFRGKARTAFRAGFLGLESLGRSTLAQIVEASEKDRRAAVEVLAVQLVECFGAPDLATARQAQRRRSVLRRRFAIIRQACWLP
jgi:hypothetical protein